MRSLTAMLPRSSFEVTIKDKETVQKLILELDGIVKQLKDVEEQMPNKESAN